MNTNRIFALINLAVFLDTVLYGLVVPVVPHYATVLGATPTGVGVIFAAYSAGLLLASVPAGLACDRYGYKPVMLLGMAGLTLSTLIFAFSGHIWLLAVSRLVQGVAGAATWAAGLALVAFLYPPHLRGQKMGIVMTSTGAGTITGPLLGGALYQFAGYSSPFLITALGGALLTVLLWCNPLPGRPAATAPGSGRPACLPELRKLLLQNRNLFWGVMITVVGSFGFGIIEPLLPLDLHRRLGLPSAGVGLLFAAFSLSYALFQPLFGTISDRLGRKPLLVGGLVSTAATIPWLALAPDVKMETAVMILLGATTGAYSTPALPMLAESVEQNGQPAAVKSTINGCGHLKEGGQLDISPAAGDANPAVPDARQTGTGITRPVADDKNRKRCASTVYAADGENPANGPYGTAFGLFNSAYSLGLVGGPLMGTFLAQRWGLPAVLLTYSILLLLTTAGVVAQLRETLQGKSLRN
ncbi:MFS transporter [Desulfofundulus thermobenzoicus]|uniref:MFS transporter n=1 Tax=Desulfofundulus thermobenzoicus TaxID=29376 RepID=A0A6N7ILN8_9FIRM|nr:MFS transporter [Desulfofundulus thermobenzoicus]MQL50896.1 MFS transporter [Desulfofundulus thermobenzoicus]